MRNTALLILLPAAGLFSCGPMLNTHVSVSPRAELPADSALSAHRASVKARFASMGGIRKIWKDITDDDFVDGHVRLFWRRDSVLPDTSRMIMISEVSGKAHREDFEWLLYKLRKESLKAGANAILFFDTSNYQHSLTFGNISRLFKPADERPESDPPAEKFTCRGTAVFIPSLPAASR